MFHVVLHNPVIPPNTGNIIRTTAVVGAQLHLIEPLGFSLDDAHLRRAGLDYHDLAHVLLHPDVDALVGVLDGSASEVQVREAHLSERRHRRSDGGEATSRAQDIAPTGRIFAFSGRATRSFADVHYHPGDALLFGTETTGLPTELLDDPRLTDLVRIPMQPGVRSLNLANSVALGLYEAWRQHGYTGGV